MAARNSMSFFSIIFSVASLLFILTGFSIPVAALAIVTGLLSRGSSVLDQRAKIGIALALLSIAATICVIIWSFNSISMEDLQQLVNQYRQMYGA